VPGAVTAATIRLRGGNGIQRETLGTFGPGGGARSYVTRDYDPRTDHAAMACPPGACPSTIGSPMDRPSHESSRSVPTPRRGRAGALDPTLPSAALRGFGHRVTLPDGDRISYVDLGPLTGRPVLYLHGTPGTRLMAAGLADAAEELGLRVLAPDRPGCGGSTFRRRSATMRRSSLGSRTRAGSPTSGLSACRVAAATPARAPPSSGRG
jgi:hypothetical protein